LRVSAANRFVSVAIAVALAAPPFVEARHAALTTHVACPIDGRIEDAPSAPAETAHSHGSGVVLEDRGGPEQHSHRACEAIPAARQRAAVTAQSGGGVRLHQIERPAPALRDEPRAAAVALYEVAPKLSPPA
jgi:hypothetical protein